MSSKHPLLNKNLVLLIICQGLFLTNNVTFIAQWSAISYSITYDLNGFAGVAPTETTKNIGNVFTIKVAPSRPGHTFTGWLSGGITYQGGDSYTVASNNVTFLAQWSANTFTVNLNSQGGSGVASSTTTTTTSQLADPGSPSRTGYTFSGWFTTPTGGNKIAFPYTHNQTDSFTIYAQWSAIDYAITYDLNGFAGVTPTETTKNISNTFAVQSAPSRTGYIFVGWLNNGVTYQSGDSYTVASNDVTFTAQWSAINYSIAYDLNNGVGAPDVTYIQSDKNIGETFTIKL
jgi:uncharacterized repeat protein (TIGR02543 family)